MTTAPVSTQASTRQDDHPRRQLSQREISAAAHISDASGKRPYQSFEYGTAAIADQLSQTPERRISVTHQLSTVLAATVLGWFRISLSRPACC
ncbi:MAG: hypothetical protein ABSA53_33785 [Streptosporangiaceae bacterium]